MNVLLSSCGHWWNAEAAYAATLAEALRDAGHGVWLLAPPETRNGEALRQRGLPLLEGLPLWSGNPAVLAGALWRLRRWQRAQRIDVVNVFRARETALHALVNRGTGTALVRTRGTARPLRVRPWNRAAYRDGGDALILPCQAQAHAMASALGSLHRVHGVVYYPAPEGAPPTPEAVQAARAALLAEHGWPEDALLFGLVGRVMPEKGHDRLLEAWPTVLAAAPRARLLLFDKGYPGEVPHKEALSAQIAEQGLADSVRWAGFRADLPACVAALEAVVIPSLSSELNCRVAVEAFAVGTPVAAFPTGALPEVVAHGVSGLVTAGPEPGELAQALLRIAQDPALRQRLATGARDAAAERFARGRFLEQTLALYAQALAHRRG